MRMVFYIRVSVPSIAHISCIMQGDLCSARGHSAWLSAEKSLPVMFSRSTLLLCEKGDLHCLCVHTHVYMQIVFPSCIWSLLRSACGMLSISEVATAYFYCECVWEKKEAVPLPHALSHIHSELTDKLAPLPHTWFCTSCSHWKGYSRGLFSP